MVDAGIVATLARGAVVPAAFAARLGGTPPRSVGWRMISMRARNLQRYTPFGKDLDLDRKGTFMRRKLALLTTAGLAASVVVGALVGSTSAPGATTLTVIEHEVHAHFVDLGRNRLNPGDSFTFHNPIYDSTDTSHIGRDHGFCIRITRTLNQNKGSFECESTTFFDGGASSITTEAAYYDTGAGVGAVTGGTGSYVGASGSVDFQCSETACTFKFNLS
jgi:hypothetical protein